MLHFRLYPMLHTIPVTVPGLIYPSVFICILFDIAEVVLDLNVFVAG